MKPRRGIRIFLAILLGILTLLLIGGITIAAVPGGINSVEQLSNSGNVSNVFIIIIIALLVLLVLGTIIYFIMSRKSSRAVPLNAMPRLQVESPMLRLSFDEEPLKAQSLISVILSLTELHTKCWLIPHIPQFD
jgi:mannitol-specific phosphotransferase system IIBC component